MKKTLIFMLTICCIVFTGCENNTGKSNEIENSRTDIQNFNIVEEADNMNPEDYSDFIKKCAIYYSNYVNVSDYSNITYSIRRNATDDEDSYLQREFNEIYRIIDEQSEIISYPKEIYDRLVKTYGDNLKTEYEDYYKDKYDSLSEYIVNEYKFSSIDSFNEYVGKEAEDYLKQEMIIYIIAYKNGIDVSKNEIIDYAEDLVKYYEYDSVEEMELKCGKAIYEEMGYQILQDKVMNYLINISTNI